MYKLAKILTIIITTPIISVSIFLAITLLGFIVVPIYIVVGTREGMIDKLNGCITKIEDKYVKNESCK